MKRMLRGLLGAIGVAMLMMWSAGASAQTVTCSGTTCKYGPICPDAWGGCYYYYWSIGSAINDWYEEKGIASIVAECDKTNDPVDCIKVKSGVELETELPEGGYNSVVFCAVPGADTCTGKGCGKSRRSSGNPFANIQAVYTSETTVQNCKKDNKSGNVKCFQNNILSGPKGESSPCQNDQWIVVDWWPLLWYATTTVTGPTSRNNDDPIPPISQTLKCTLYDPEWNAPNSAEYSLSSNLGDNHLVCIE